MVYVFAIMFAIFILTVIIGSLALIIFLLSIKEYGIASVGIILWLGLVSVIGLAMTL